MSFTPIPKIVLLTELIYLNIHIHTIQPVDRHMKIDFICTNLHLRGSFERNRTNWVAPYNYVITSYRVGGLYNVWLFVDEDLRKSDFFRFASKCNLNTLVDSHFVLLEEINTEENHKSLELVVPEVLRDNCVIRISAYNIPNMPWYIQRGCPEIPKIDLY